MPRNVSIQPRDGIGAEPRLIDIRSIRALPQSTEAWQLAVRDTPLSCDPARLYRLLVLVSPGANTIRQMIPMTQDLGEEGEIVSALETGMLQPHGSLVPARPPAIWVDDQRVAECISLPMESCGVRVLLKTELPAIEPVLEALALRPNIFSDGPLFGTSVREQELAAAAAQVAEHEPWRYFSGELPLEIKSRRGDIPDSFVVVLGQLREVEGVASYNSEDAYLTASSLPQDMLEDEEGFVNSLTFDRASEVPREARLAFERRALPVAHGLYPRFMHFALGGRPDVMRDERDADRLLRDLHAVAALLEHHRELIADGVLNSCVVESAGDTVEIRARPDLVGAAAESSEPPPAIIESSDEHRLPQLVGGEHALLVGDLATELIEPLVEAEELAGLTSGELPGTVRALIIKGTKKIVARASEDMHQVEEIGFGSYRGADDRGHEVVLGYRNGEPLFVMASVPESDDRPRLRELVTDEEQDTRLLVVFLGGGARRSLRRLRASAIVGVHVLPHRRLPAS